MTNVSFFDGDTLSVYSTIYLVLLNIVGYSIIGFSKSRSTPNNAKIPIVQNDDTLDQNQNWIINSRNDAELKEGETHKFIQNITVTTSFKSNSEFFF